MDNDPVPVEPHPLIPPTPRSPKKIIWGGLIIAVSLGVGAGVLALSGHFPASVMSLPAEVKSPTLDSEGLPSFTGTVSVPFEQQSIALAPAVAQNFSTSEIQNLDEMEKAYGVKFTQSDLDHIEKNKFVVKNLMDTNLPPVSVGYNSREFVSLYSKISGSADYKERTQANAVFISSDVLMNLFSILSVDLLKETENKYLYPQMLPVTRTPYL